MLSLRGVRLSGTFYSTTTIKNSKGKMWSNYYQMSFVYIENDNKKRRHVVFLMPTHVA